MGYIKRVFAVSVSACSQVTATKASEFSLMSTCPIREVPLCCHEIFKSTELCEIVPISSTLTYLSFPSASLSGLRSDLSNAEPTNSPLSKCAGCQTSRRTLVSFSIFKAGSLRSSFENFAKLVRQRRSHLCFTSFCYVFIFFDVVGKGTVAKD